MWAAKQRGGAEHFDWGILEYQMAALLDSLSYNTSVTAAHGSGKRPKMPKPSFRPSGSTEKTIKPKSIKDMKGFSL